MDDDVDFQFNTAEDMDIDGLEGSNTPSLPLPPVPMKESMAGKGGSESGKQTHTTAVNRTKGKPTACKSVESTFDAKDDFVDVEYLDEEGEVPAVQVEDDGEADTVEPKKKHRSLRLHEDPLQHHAKPKDLISSDPVPVSSSSSSGPQSQTALATTIFASKRFSEIPGLHPKLVRALEGAIEEGGLGLKSSTKVQGSVLPLLVRDKGSKATSKRKSIDVEVPRSVLLKSQTGSGKTLAFLLPLIHDLMSLPTVPTRDMGTHALVMSPTRELCTQICQVAERLTNRCACTIVTGTVTGGEKKKAEKARLRKGIVLLIATPGRLLDHLKTTESFTLTHLRWVVLDEADRLLDMGFEKNILEILSILRGEEVGAAAVAGASRSRAAQNLERRYRDEAAKHAKISRDVASVCYVMASATLSQAVCKLVKPVMGSAVAAAKRKRLKKLLKKKRKRKSDGDGDGADNGNDDDAEADDDDDDGDSAFYIVDAEAEQARLVRPSEVDTMMSSTRTGDGTVYMPTGLGDDGGGSAIDVLQQESSGSKHGTSLRHGEVVAAPATLVQYTMTVTAKWRLAALVSFLRAKARERSKIIVFMATCDSVDFHALLFRSSLWPQDLDPNPRDTEEGDRSKGVGSDNHPSSVDGTSGFGSDAKGSKGIEAALAVAEDTHKRQQRGSAVLKEEDLSLEPLEMCCQEGLFGPSVPVYRLHGNVPQRMRSDTLAAFSAATEGILICTDVAARGLDIPRVDWIVQYDPPCESSDYIHRAGRTARSGHGGSALLFLMPAEASFATLLHSHGMYTHAMRLDSVLMDVVRDIPGAQRFKVLAHASYPHFFFSFPSLSSIMNCLEAFAYIFPHFFTFVLFDILQSQSFIECL